MAEARMGVARNHITMHRFGQEVDTSVRRPQISLTKNGLVVYIPPVRSLLFGIRRKFWMYYTKLRLAFKPLPIPFVVLLTGGIIYYGVNEPTSWVRTNRLSQFALKLDKFNPLKNYLSPTLRLSAVGAAVGNLCLFAFTASQRFLLRKLLAYHGWMYERRTRSLATTVWGVLLKYVFVRRTPNDLNAFQSSLPTLPLPDIEATVEKYLSTMTPLLDEQEMAEMSGLAKDFLRSEGPTLQWYLKLKWLVSPNYISDWWLNYVYLRGRESIAINSNWAGIMYANYCATPDRCAHAAVVIHEFLVCRQLLYRGNLEPQMIADVVPLCMDQYEKMFATTRIPGEIQDELQQTDLEDSRHIVVMHKGFLYKVQTYSPNTGRILRPAELYPVLQSIVDSTDVADKHELLMPALTCMNRTEWARIREDEFLANPLNKSSLECIERAAFILVFEDDAVGDLTAEIRNLLIGNGHNRWADKSFAVVIQTDGRIGVHVEHAWADASTVGHLLEKVSLADEDRRFYNEDGSLKVTAKDTQKLQKHRLTAQRLKFQLSEGCRAEIERASTTYSAACDDLDLNILRFSEYGKAMAKKAKCSPDAWIQMALQLAYFRDQGRFDQTYESATTRLFKYGRTETIRSASVASVAFVRDMENAESTDASRLALLRTACESHQQYTYDAMTGKGVDRHLFGLYVVSAGKGIDSPFLKKALSRKWKLSTSQVPTRQLPAKEHTADQTLLETSNGAFGPVADDGYGVLYAIYMEDLLYFTVTAKKSCSTTDAGRFADGIKKALLDMAKLVENLPAEAPRKSKK